MQLVAYGAQDVYLTGQPKVTFFQAVYKRHTNFAMEAILQTVNGSAANGARVSVTIARNGDLVGNMYVSLLPITANTTSNNTGFDTSTLPPKFTLRELQERIVAANASPVGFVQQLSATLGNDGEITRKSPRAGSASTGCTTLIELPASTCVARGSIEKPSGWSAEPFQIVLPRMRRLVSARAGDGTFEPGGLHAEIGFGHRGQPLLPVEPADFTGASERLYQVFNLETLLAWPHDYLGKILAENRHGQHLGFYPTPMSVACMMAAMTVGGEDARTKSVCDPCVGTGRLLLAASNHSYRLYGCDLNPTVLKATLVNGYLYAPWLGRPFPFLDPQLVEAAASQAISDSIIQQACPDQLATTEHDVDAQPRFDTISRVCAALGVRLVAQVAPR